MLIHEFKYFLKVALRDKCNIFWVLFFPIILGTLFHIAFGGYTEGETFQTIPVAVVSDESDTAKEYQKILEELTKQENDALLEITMVSKEEAEKLLEEKKIDGILTASDKLKLTVSAEMKNSKLNQSILESVVNQINSRFTIVTNVMKKDPSKISEVLSVFEGSDELIKEESFTEGNTDVTISYFNNLLAMACLFTSLTGCGIAVKNQANLSDIGARKNVSPTHKLVSITAALVANVLIQTICIALVILYLVFVLKVKFGVSVLPLMFIGFVGCLVGISFGFFVGSFGQMMEKTKMSILTAVSMICCFLSGLMVANMRIIVEGIFPFFNKINPAALISDSFYALNVYDTYERFMGNIVTLLILSVIFTVGGFLIVRRQKYASL